MKHTMKRRDVLTGAGLVAAGATLSVPAPAIAQGLRQLKMVTDWPADMPGLQTSARRLAHTITEATKGRIKIEVFPAGALVRPFETFDAVGAGVADMYHSFEGYFERKAAALHFFSAMPFGFTANELFAWIRYGGGQELWDELNGQFNVKALLACSTGCQMGGWFAHEIAGSEGFKGLRYRMAGPGAEVLRRLGATVVLLPGGEIVPAIKSGAIHASEWIGPWLDMAIGLHKAVGYYYYPGFHEPGSGFSLGINKGVWESLDAGDRRLIEACAFGEYAHSLAEFNTNNALALRQLREARTVKILKFDDALLKTLGEISKDVVAQAGSGDDISRKIYASYQQFRTSIMDWSDISERAYLNSRGLA
jgi:TRAP-type mannitol/chloroaromatic compound transport system substrate-binding protein